MAKRWIAVEKDDDNACEPCDAIDGTTYRNREDAYRDYPGGVGYRDCVGAKFGNACRGKVVKRRGAERAEDSGMTDVRLLNEFKARLVERERISASMLKAADSPRKRPANGKDWVRIENAHAEEAFVYINDEIGFWGTTASSFIDQLNGVTAPKITVFINSPGGEVWDGLAIHTALAESKAHVTTFVTGLAASAASYIAMAGDTIKTARNAMWMLHDASGGVWGNATSMRAQADLLDKVTMNIADMYAMQTGDTAEEWFAKLENQERWYTGQEALDIGLADEMTDPDEGEEPEEVLDRLSLAVFNFSGRAKPRADDVLRVTMNNIDAKFTLTPEALADTDGASQAWRKAMSEVTNKLNGA